MFGNKASKAMFAMIEGPDDIIAFTGSDRAWFCAYLIDKMVKICLVYDRSYELGETKT